MTELTELPVIDTGTKNIFPSGLSFIVRICHPVESLLSFDYFQLLLGTLTVK